MKTLIILATIREERKSHRLAEYLLQRIAEKEISVELIDLQKIILPHFGSKTDNYYNIEFVKNSLEKADAIIFVSPEYHQTYTSTLKNMVEYYWAEFSKKPIGVATTSAGKFGGVQASIHLQSLVLALGGYPIPVKLLVPEIQNAFNENNEPLNAEIEINTELFLTELLNFSKIFRK